jgi:hypothetical protein
MADTPDTARRIAEFVNYLDTLTAKLAEVEVERDALRAAVVEARYLFTCTDTYQEWVAHRIDAWMEFVRTASGSTSREGGQ